MKEWLRKAGLFLLLFTSVLLPAESYASINCGSGGGDQTLIDTTAICKQGDPLQHAFSYLACSYIGMLNSVLGAIFCSLKSALQPIIDATMTLYVVFFGCQILMGMTRLTAKEIVVRIVKLVAVALLANDGEWGVGRLFDFFVQLSTEGSSWVLGATNFGGSDQQTIYSFLDQVVYAAISGPITDTNGKLLAFVISLGLIIQPLLVLALYWLWNNVIIIALAIRNFMLSISAIAFLLSISPIFLALALFKPTFVFFDSWLKYMISYSIQVIIVFGCVALWIMVMSSFSDYFVTLGKMVDTNTVAPTRASSGYLDDSYTICDISGGGTGAGAALRAEKGLLVMDCTGGDPIPLSRIPEYPNFIYMMAYNFTTLIIIAYAFGALMSECPNIARQLSGPEFVPILGQGFGFSKYGQVVSKAAEASGASNFRPGAPNRPTGIVEDISQMSNRRSNPD